MNRVTKTERIAGHTVHYISDNDIFEITGCPGKITGFPILRLSTYEDTGLEPEELAQAEKEGRLVVLPCNVGDTVFVITQCYNVAMLCDNDYFTGTGAIECPFENSCDIEECNDDNVRIFETTVTDFWHGEQNCTEMRFESLSMSAPISAIGKTVFLTREAAEAALKEREAEHDR